MQPALRIDPVRFTSGKYRFVPITLLILLCIVFSATRWLKTESFWGDSSRWIFEAWRASMGELPYRDFAWQYPPLALLLFRAAFRIFGPSFVVAQLVIDIVSVAIVLLSWRVARRLLPHGLAFAVTAALACAGASNTGNFALFSLQIYTPAVLVGMVGLLLMLEAVIARIEEGLVGKTYAALLCAGATIALLSKPEFAMGAAGALVAEAAYEARLCLATGAPVSVWLRRQASLFGLALLPALTIYGLISWKTGVGNLLTGLSGYGMAQLVCPWWPTGLGLFGALVALCQGAAVVLFIQWLSRENSNPPSRSVHTALSAAAVLAVPLTFFYVPYCVKELPVFTHGNTPLHMISFFLSTGTVLLPIMWSSIVLWPALVFGIWHGKELSRENAAVLTLATAGLLISARTLFGGSLSQLTSVTVAAYPIWFILGPLLIERFLHRTGAGASQRVYSPVVVLIALYALLRFGVGVIGERRFHYVTVDTAAGKVHVLDHASSAPVYRYVVEHTSSTDGVLDISYGGAVNFAGRRTSPLYSTQFSALAPAQRYLDKDIDQIRARPPKLVIGNDSPDSGAEYGLCAETGCMFPAIVWRSTRLACDPNRKFPVLEYIKQNYTPVARLGKKTIYEQKPRLSAVN
jgi:hypothetical protein